MARFQENDLPKAKLNTNSLSKAIQIFKYAEHHKWKFYVGLVFLLMTGATALAFPKLMGMLVDCVKNKDIQQTNTIALSLVGILLLQSFFSFFRLSLFINFTLLGEILFNVFRSDRLRTLQRHSKSTIPKHLR